MPTHVVQNTPSGFNCDVTDAADDVVVRRLVFFDGNHLDWEPIVLRTQDKLASRELDVFEGAGVVLANGVYVRIILSVGSQRIVMAINEDGCTWNSSGEHAVAFACVEANENEPLPLLTRALQFRAKSAEERLLEFENVFHGFVGEKRLLSSNGRIHQYHILEVIFTGRKNAGTLINFRGVEKIEDRKMLDGQHFIHAFEAQAALAIEEVGNMSLLEAGLSGELEAGQIARFNALPQSLAQIFLQRAEFHGHTITPRIAIR